MKKSDFYFELPVELIAEAPLPERSGSRLLHVNRAKANCVDKRFSEIIDLINPNDLLVFNNTKVMQARLFAKKSTGGQLELLIERIIDDRTVLAHMRSAKKLQAGDKVYIDSTPVFELLDREKDLFKLRYLLDKPFMTLLENHGHMPLPPYIKRPDNSLDQSRYQTVYAKTLGAVAAPTAGLHFDETILEKLRLKGIHFAEITLHVGAGTFQPVKVDDIFQHTMHTELMEVSESVCESIRACRERGGRVIAVGTTVVRALESVGANLKPYTGETAIFIYPGYEFKVVDALLTNFHLPESTLLMLVSAFSSQALIHQAYQHAIEKVYRFFSYGDAMFID